VISIIEPQKKFKLNNFTIYDAQPSLVKQNKLNACLCIHNEISSTLRVSHINYVSCIAQGQPFLRETLVASIYINPNPKASALNRRTVREAVKDLEDWLNSHPNH
jgi:hypothetical protein